MVIPQVILGLMRETVEHCLVLKCERKDRLRELFEKQKQKCKVDLKNYSECCNKMSPKIYA